MKVAVVFDSPHSGWDHSDHEERMELETSVGYADEAQPEYQVARALRDRGHTVWLVGAENDPGYVSQFLAERAVDVVWNAAEGFRDTDALDFLLPAVLEADGYSYTGAPPQGLVLTRNKAVTKKILQHHGVNAPSFRTFRRSEKVPRDLDLELPAIVKPLRLDASVGISKASVVSDPGSLAERVAFIHERCDDDAIVEQFIEGRELYVSALGNGDKLEILPIVELVFDKCTPPAARIATRAAKWDDPYRLRNGIRSVFARPLSRVARERIEESCRVAFRTLWLRDYARFDLRLDHDDRVWMIKANANPYICDGHEIAAAALKAGIDYPSLIDKIIRMAARRRTSH